MCSNLYYSERAHCEYHVRSEGSHFHPLRKKNLEKFEYRNTEFYFDFRFSIFAPWRFCAQICTIANVLIANIMFAVEVLTFTHLRKENLEKFEYRSTEFYFNFRFSRFSPLAFLCSNLYYSERAHFTHLRKKNLKKFEYRNTEFYFDFRFSIFAALAFLCSNLYYSEHAHCEYHVCSGGSHFHPSTKEKLGKI